MYQASIEMSWAKWNREALELCTLFTLRCTKQAMEKATAGGDPILLPTICIVEATYLVEKNRIQTEALARLEHAVGIPDSFVQPVALTAEIVVALKKISRNSVPNMPDRIIAATALALALPLVTRDGKIRAWGIGTIW